MIDQDSVRTIENQPLRLWSIALSLILGTMISTAVPSWAAESERESLTIVSDLDDTLQITDVADPKEAFLRTLVRRRGFAGMSQLFRAWADSGSNRFVLLSGSPNWVIAGTRNFLERENFPSMQIIQRAILKERDLVEFKLDNLKSIHRQNPHSRFLLIGDDTQADPEVFLRFQAETGAQVLRIYIRQVRGRVLPNEVIPFTDASEIASLEAGDFGQNRLTVAQVQSVYEATSVAKRTHLVPRFVNCEAITRNELWKRWSQGFEAIQNSWKGWNDQYRQMQSLKESVCDQRRGQTL